MKRHSNSYRSRIWMLISVMVLMMLLCGCRTRITNNTEVAEVVNDDSGMLYESYQVRRDELGIPVAEPPLFTGFGSGDEDYDDSEDYDGYDDFDSEDEYDEDEDLYSEDDEGDENEDSPTSGTTTGTTNTTRPVNRQQTSTTNRVVRRPSVTQTTTVRVSLDLNGKDAKCSRTSLTVKKGSTYGPLPTPTRSGYDFDGWYTAKTNGSKVTSKTKVTKDKAHTLYAHWSKIEAKTYTVTFDGNGDGDDVELSSTEITVKEGGTYGKMPSAKRDKYKFSGWFTDASGGSQVTSDTKFKANKDQTLYAHWEEDAYNWWNNEFTTAANDITETVDVKIDGGESTAKKKLVETCKGNVTNEVSDSVIVLKFLEDFSEDSAADEAEKIYDKLNSEAEEGESGETVNPVIVIISDDAVSGSDKQKLIYKILMLNALHGESGIDYEEAASDLEADVYPPYIYP